MVDIGRADLFFVALLDHHPHLLAALVHVRKDAVNLEVVARFVGQREVEPLAVGLPCKRRFAESGRQLVFLLGEDVAEEKPVVQDEPRLGLDAVDELQAQLGAILARLAGDVVVDLDHEDVVFADLQAGALGVVGDAAAGRPADDHGPGSHVLAGGRVTRPTWPIGVFCLQAFEHVVVGLEVERQVVLADREGEHVVNDLRVAGDDVGSHNVAIFLQPQVDREAAVVVPRAALGVVVDRHVVDWDLVLVGTFEPGQLGGCPRILARIARRHVEVDPLLDGVDLLFAQPTAVLVAVAGAVIGHQPRRHGAVGHGVGGSFAPRPRVLEVIELERPDAPILVAHVALLLVDRLDVVEVGDLASLGVAVVFRLRIGFAASGGHDQQCGSRNQRKCPERQSRRVPLTEAHVFLPTPCVAVHATMPRGGVKTKNASACSDQYRTTGPMLIRLARFSASFSAPLNTVKRQLWPIGG